MKFFTTILAAAAVGSSMAAPAAEAKSTLTIHRHWHDYLEQLNSHVLHHHVYDHHNYHHDHNYRHHHQRRHQDHYRHRHCEGQRFCRWWIFRRLFGRLVCSFVTTVKAASSSALAHPSSAPKDKAAATNYDSRVATISKQADTVKNQLIVINKAVQANEKPTVTASLTVTLESELSVLLTDVTYLVQDLLVVVEDVLNIVLNLLASVLNILSAVVVELEFTLGLVIEEVAYIVVPTLTGGVDVILNTILNGLGGSISTSGNTTTVSGLSSLVSSLTGALTGVLSGSTSSSSTTTTTTTATDTSTQTTQIEAQLSVIQQTVIAISQGDAVVTAP
ncbi:hypothetical protein B0H63DRAFT_515196 [Podospora didyma]|uniref:Uncharacterized protein n=1 Tax=Podospora didyma TaxID=330526 RepID=A0AAE0N3A0_9PEZI|nr:hypothetical protein B0H63DRAFT_515196 [Podospora didyma]